MTVLDDHQRTTWLTQGWLHLPGALPATTVADLDRWVGEVEAWSAGDGPGLHHVELTDRGPQLARSEDFEPHHPGLSSFLRTGPVVDVLTELFGEPAVLFKEKVNYKGPGGAGFAPHQDASAYRFVDHHLSCMVPLDPATEVSGCLYFAPIERHLLPHRDGRIDAGWAADAAWTPAEVEPGDLVVFDSYTPHHSGTNSSARARRALYLTYNAASAGDHRAEYYRDKAALLAGLDGEEADRVRLSVNDDFLGRPVPRPG
ncbi:MAG: phytanoyl-CoA dioxygenase family protein [Acidimicrobiales bacterium]